MMKKILTFLSTILCFNVYAVNPTQGPLQQDPSLCSYGYNPNCNQNSNTSVKKIIEHKIVYLPSKYGAIANDKNTGTIGSSINMNTESEAKKAAIHSCQNGNKNLSCKIVASYGNGCIAAVGGRKKVLVLFKAIDENPGGHALKKALRKCEKSGATDCQVLIEEQCSR